ncbi:hypothetical protein C8J57DRAFT_1230235 [Mycena rebaudengoi]|nr:hypothetical protein C8J57DRAFT_1230235 [Mycena rebaudengoi]
MPTETSSYIHVAARKLQLRTVGWMGPAEKPRKLSDAEETKVQWYMRKTGRVRDKALDNRRSRGLWVYIEVETSGCEALMLQANVHEERYQVCSKPGTKKFHQYLMLNRHGGRTLGETSSKSK